MGGVKITINGVGVGVGVETGTAPWDEIPLPTLGSDLSYWELTLAALNAKNWSAEEHELVTVLMYRTYYDHFPITREIYQMSGWLVESIKDCLF